MDDGDDSSMEREGDHEGWVIMKREVANSCLGMPLDPGLRYRRHGLYLATRHLVSNDASACRRAATIRKIFGLVYFLFFTASSEPTVSRNETHLQNFKSLPGSGQGQEMSLGATRRGFCFCKTTQSRCRTKPSLSPFPNVSKMPCQPYSIS